MAKKVFKRKKSEDYFNLDKMTEKQEQRLLELMSEPDANAVNISKKIEEEYGKPIQAARFRNFIFDKIQDTGKVYKVSFKKKGMGRTITWHETKGIRVVPSRVKEEFRDALVGKVISFDSKEVDGKIIITLTTK